MDAKDKLKAIVDGEKKSLEKLENELRGAKARIGAFRETAAALAGVDEEGPAGAVCRRLQDKVKKEQGNIDELEAKLVDLRGRVEAFEEALRLFPREGEEVELRSGSALADVRRVLREKGIPMLLSEIMTTLGKDPNDVKNRNSLRGSLAKYAQDGRVFTKEEAPDTFGLLEFRSENGNQS